MKALDRFRISGNHKTKIIEEYLDTEINDILNRKRLATNEYQNYSAQPTYYEDPLSNKVKSLFRNRNDKEQYLPFKKDEIRPVIREKQQTPEVGELILGLLGPIVEDWVDDNLERIVYKVVKRNLLRNNEKLHQAANNIYDYYEQENNDYEEEKHHPRLEARSQHNRRNKNNSAAYYQQLHDNSRHNHENNHRSRYLTNIRRPKR